MAAGYDDRVNRRLLLLVLGAWLGPACTPVCTGATCADRFSLADLRGVVAASGDLNPAAAAGHIAGQVDEGRLRSFARVGDGALLVGLPDASKVQLYSGAFYLGSDDVELDGSPGSGFGASVGSATQLVIGAPQVGDGPSLPSVGRVYVFPFDRPSALTTLSDASQVVDGELAADGFGSTVAACGDIDGDGSPDVVAAAPAAHDLSGRVVLIPGGSTAESAADLAGWDGDAPGAALGTALACGDFDGDGLDDAVIGEPYADGVAGPGAGAVLIIGAAGELFRLEGGHDNAYLGASLAIADVDADGIPDLIVGATGRPAADAAADDLAGAVHVYNGGRLRNAAAGEPSVLGLGEDAVIVGQDERARTGSSVAAGDVDGDGVGDVLVGAPGTNTGAAATGAQTGAIFVLNGPFGGGLHPAQRDERGLDDAALVIRGTRVYERVGEVAALVNLDGADGDDVLFTTREEE